MVPLQVAKNRQSANTHTENNKTVTQNMYKRKTGNKTQTDTNMIIY